MVFPCPPRPRRPWIGIGKNIGVEKDSCLIIAWLAQSVRTILSHCIWFILILFQVERETLNQTCWKNLKAAGKREQSNYLVEPN